MDTISTVFSGQCGHVFQRGTSREMCRLINQILGRLKSSTSSNSTINVDAMTSFCKKVDDVRASMQLDAGWRQPVS